MLKNVVKDCRTYKKESDGARNWVKDKESVGLNNQSWRTPDALLMAKSKGEECL